jgi:hypothetical protein
VHNDSEKWDAVTPDLKSQDSSEAARLFRNHVLAGSTIPEHWFGGGGNVNRATAGEMDEPTFKIFSMRQRFLKYMLESMGIYVLRQKFIAENGDEPDISESAFQVETIFPEMTPKDTTKYASALQQVVVAVGIAIDKQLLQKTTAVRIINSIAGRLGIEIDADEELGKVAQAANAAYEDVFSTPNTADAVNT